MISDDTKFDFNTKIKNELCPQCICGKQKETQYKSSESKANSPFELIHTDVCQAGTPSVSNKNYFITFMDDYTSFLWTFPIQHKSDVVVVIKNFVRTIKTQFNKNVKILRSDKGGEYINQNLDSFFKKRGMIHQTSAAYTPQQNGRAERINLTLFNLIRTILKDSQAPKIYWAEALNCVNYTLNRSPNKSNNYVTPYQMLYGKTPKFHRLRIFGCVAYALHKPKKSKLDPKSTPLMFVGYSNHSKAYRLLNPVSNMILETESVVFDENKFFYKKEEDKNNIEPTTSHNSDDNDTETERHDSQSSDETEEENFKPNDAKSEEYSSDDSDEDVQRQSTRHRKPPPLRDKNTGIKRFLPNIFKRESKPPDRYGDWTESIVIDCITEPQTITEAKNTDEWHHWEQAIQNELEQMKKNNVWEICDSAPPNTKIINSRWIFKKKTDINGKTIYRARLVAKGFQQTVGVNYEETYAPVTSIDTIRLAIANAAANNYYIQQVDITTAFLNSTLKEDVYMKIPDGMVSIPNKILKLNRSLYGLKQSPKNWNENFSEKLKANGFEVSESDNCLFKKKIQNDEEVSIILYVDDMLIISPNLNQINSIKNLISKHYEIKDLGRAKKFLGIQLDYSDNGILIHQTQYAQNLLKKFGMNESKSCKTPAQPNIKLLKSSTDDDLIDETYYRSIIGGLMYLTNLTRPDISFAVNYAARFCSNPNKTHLGYVKHILRYLNSTSNLGILYKNKKSSCLKFFSDSDYGSDLVDSKSTSGIISTYNDSPISWRSIKQRVVALSTAEAEIIAATTLIKTALHINDIYKFITNNNKNETLQIFGDNNSANLILTNNIITNRTKHIRIKFSFVKDLIDKNIIKLNRIDTNDNLADIFTKALPINKFMVFIRILNMNEFQPE